MQAVDLLEFQVYLIRKYLRMNEKKKKKMLRREFVILLLVLKSIFFLFEKFKSSFSSFFLLLLFMGVGRTSVCGFDGLLYFSIFIKIFIEKIQKPI